ncbi:MAG: 30S ribosomal protein S6 [Firmicutes bacterium]|nr:30S ribosomal protein S6 [Bacillota bacterium]
MPHYEVMFVVQPDLEGEALEGALSKVEELIKQENGEIISLKKMGRRKLAYEIEEFKEGYYAIVNLEADKGIVPVLDHFFKVNEGYLRYIVIRQDGTKKAQKDGEEVAATEDDEQTAEKVQGENIKGE